MSKRSRGKGKGTADLAALQRDNRGRFIGGSKQRSLATPTATPETIFEDESVEGNNNDNDNGSIQGWLDRVQIDKDPTASPNMDIGRSRKRQRMSCMLPWVHDTMKQDLVEAHSKSAQEFTNCCNWWYRAILWKKIEFSKTDKDQFCQCSQRARRAGPGYGRRRPRPSTPGPAPARFFRPATS